MTYKKRPAHSYHTSRTAHKISASISTIAEAISAYILHHEAIGSQPATLTGHKHCLGLFQEFCFQEDITYLSDVTPEDLQRWIIELQQRPSNRGSAQNGKIAPRTISWYTRSLYAFLHWCLRRGFVETDLTTYLDRPKLDKPLIRILEPEEFMRLVHACKPDMENNGATGPHVVARNEAILWLFYDTGIRLAELCNLRIADFDKTRGTIIVYGKGRKERKIALGKNALLVLSQYLYQWREEFGGANYSNNLFVTETGSIGRAGIKMLLLRIRHRAGLDERRVHPHLFRHTFAVRYLMAGGDVFTLQELLGHEDMETIRNYMHLADVNVQTQKRKFSPGDQLDLPAKKMRRAGFRQHEGR